jgi:hypothetical protein
MTTRATKVQNTDRIAISIEQGDYVYPPDWSGIGELRRFTLKTREASEGHDDMVMAMAAAGAWIESVAPTKNAFSQSRAHAY